MENFKITDYNYIGSSVGNAFFSGLSFDELWSCVSISYTREELDAAVTAQIRLNEIVNDRIQHNINT
jgi:hypothetical protein